MAKPWTAEHSVGRELARRLIDAQFPELAEGASGAELAAVGSGWDVDVWRCGEWAFRFPRRKVGIECVENELRALPHLAPRLPVAVPVPRFVGKRSAEFDAPFYGHAFLPGSTAGEPPLDDAARAALAAPLAEFLRALHGLDVSLASRAGIPADTFRGDERGAARRALEHAARLETGEWRDLARQAAARLELEVPAAPGRAAVLHGDFYGRNLLLGADHQLSAVIDWGDACVGDPAVDLAVAITFVPAAAREGFWRTYGGADAATRARAAHFGLCRHGLGLLAYAADRGDARLAHEAAFAISNALGVPG
jgi:aminoglycoside phosphotransferase (APT) family kinase protein